MGSMLGELTRDRIPADLLEAEGAVFVDVWGPRCVPCLALAPTFERLAEQFGDRARFLKLEAPANRMACVDLKVMGLPTFLAYRDGMEVDRIAGEDIEPAQLERFVNDHLQEERNEE